MMLPGDDASMTKLKGTAGVWVGGPAAASEQHPARISFRSLMKT